MAAAWGGVLHVPPLICVGLCVWQVQRAAEKKEMLEERRRALESGREGGAAGNESVRRAARELRAEAGGSVTDAAGGSFAEYTPLRLVGRFVSSATSSPPSSTKSVFIGPRPKSSMGVAQKGYMMITPMKLDGCVQLPLHDRRVVSASDSALDDRWCTRSGNVASPKAPQYKLVLSVEFREVSSIEAPQIILNLLAVPPSEVSALVQDRKYATKGSDTLNSVGRTAERYAYMSWAFRSRTPDENPLTISEPLLLWYLRRSGPSVTCYRF